MKLARPESLGYIHEFSDLKELPEFVSEYKYNGWAVCITPKAITTRHGKPLPVFYNDIARNNVKRLRDMIDWDFCNAVHAELMCITEHACPRDTLIAHDCLGGFSSECRLWDRKTLMWLSTPPIIHADGLYKSLDSDPVNPEEYPGWEESGGVWRPKRIRFFDHDVTGHSPSQSDALKEMLRFNAQCHHLFYEGFVHKKALAYYGAKNAWFKQRIQNQKLKYNKEEAYV